MKTRDLRKWFEDNKWEYVETAHYIEVLDLIKVFTESQVVKFNEYFYGNSKSLELIKVVIEYTNTPISEREDEKKYRIRIDSTLFKEVVYLTLILSKNIYYLSIFNDNDEANQRIFTQSEIDNLPQEIKGAIECGFLRKVEVE